MKKSLTLTFKFFWCKMGFSGYMRYVVITLLVALITRNVIPALSISHSICKKQRLELIHKLYAKKQGELPKLKRKHKPKGVPAAFVQICNHNFNRFCVPANFWKNNQENSGSSSFYSHYKRGPPIV